MYVLHICRDLNKYVLCTGYIHAYIYICGIEHIVAWRRGCIYTAILLRTPLFYNKHASDTPYYGIIPVSSRLRLLVILPGRFNTPLRDLIHTYEVHTIYTVPCPYVLEYSVDISTAELEKKKKNTHPISTHPTGACHPWARQRHNKALQPRNFDITGPTGKDTA